MALITTREAANRLGVEHDVLRGWVRQGTLPHYRMGTRNVRVDEADLDRATDLIRPEDVRLAPQSLPEGWDRLMDRVERLEDQLRQARLERDLALRQIQQDAKEFGRVTFSKVDSLDGRLPTDGFWVYLLRDADDEVIYVGQSTNVWCRIGSHMSSNYRDQVCSVELVRCANRAEMDAVERSLILHCDPRLNRAGRRAAA